LNPLLRLSARLFSRRVKGVRVVNLASLGCLTALVLSVYGFKTLAGREGAEIVDIDRQIVEQQRAVRLLRAEVAHLEQPRRIERLSTRYLGLQPVAARREAPAEALTEIAREGAARPPAPPRPPAPAFAPSSGEAR